MTGILYCASPRKSATGAPWHLARRSSEFSWRMSQFRRRRGVWRRRKWQSPRRDRPERTPGTQVHRTYGTPAKTVRAKFTRVARRSQTDW